MSILFKSKHCGWTHDLVRHLNKGSSGQSERDATEEEKSLWAAQADSLTKMTDIAMPNLYTGMNNLGTMANEAMDGTLATQMRNMASADATQSGSMGLAAAGRKMERFGATMNPNALAAQTNAAGLDMAKLRSNAMNLANQAAEDTKWNRNAALAGLASGQGSSAISGMSSLSNALTADRQASNSADASAYQGLGMMGAYGMNALMKKDGGYIEKGYAKGGNVDPYEKFAKVNYVDAPSIFTFDSNGEDATADDESYLSKAVKIPLSVMAANAGAKGLDMVGISGPKDAIGRSLQGAKDAYAFRGFRPEDATATYQKAFDAGTIDQAGLDAGLEAVNTASDVQKAAGSAAMESAPYLAAGKALVDIASGEDPGKAIASAAASWGGAELGSMAGTAVLPGVGTVIGGALGGLLGGELFAEGGPVPKKGLSRKDFSKKGGKVSGPGTGTSDSIPARLSDGEYVLNAEAVKMIGRDKLDAINNVGLQRRYGGKSATTGGKMLTSKQTKRSGLSRERKGV